MARYYWIQTLLKQIQMFTSLHEIEVSNSKIYHKCQQNLEKPFRQHEEQPVFFEGVWTY